MKLYINGRFLTQRVTGVQRYALEVVKAIDKMSLPNLEITLIVPPEAMISKPTLSNINIKTIGHHKGHLWLQISLPHFMRKNKGAYLTLAGLAPFFHPDYLTVHDIIAYRCPESVSKKFRMLYDFADRHEIPRAKKVFTVSEFSKNDILSVYKKGHRDDFVVAHCSANYLLNLKVDADVDEKTLAKYSLESNSYFFTVSSRNPHKNQKFMIALAKLHPEFKFVVSGGRFRSYKNVEEEEKAPTNVIYTDYVSDDELVALYRNAKGFIFPSLYEGFGMPPLEAIVLGCKYIAMSDLDVFKEIYNGVYLFDPHDPSSFDFSKFLNNPLSDELRNEYIKKYSFEETAKIIVDTIVKKENEINNKAK